MPAVNVAHCHEAWLVDLDGTLYAARPVKLCSGAELALAGWRAISVIRRFRSEHERLRVRQRHAGDPFRLQIDATARALGAAPEEVERIVTEWMLRRPGKWLRRFRHRQLIEELRRFREAGGRLALVSDYPAHGKLRALGCAELFDAVVASGEDDGPQWLKPNPDGLLRAARQLGVAPEHCQVLGDRLDADGEAARRAGMSFRKIA